MSGQYNEIKQGKRINWKALDFLLQRGIDCISDFEIYENTAKERYQDKQNNKIIKLFNEKILSKYFLPNDVSLSRVLKALRQLKKYDEAISLYEQLKRTQSAGEWSTTEIIKICVDTDKPEALAYCQEYLNRGATIDNRLAVQMMRAYQKKQDIPTAKEIYSWVRDPDENIKNKYIDILLSEKCEQSKQEAYGILEEKELACKTDLATYDTFIKHLFEENLEEAIEIYKKGREAGFLKNVSYKIGYENDQFYAVLDFHPGQKARGGDGGVSLRLAKTALICFLREYDQYNVPYDVKIITGGTRKGCTTLKEQIPVFLKDTCEIEVCVPDVNPKKVQFFVSNEAVRNGNLRKKYFELEEESSGEEQFKKSVSQLMSSYQVKMRHQYQGRMHKKHYSLEVPQSFSKTGCETARKAMGCFDISDLKGALETFQTLLTVEGGHPWSYVQCGWMYHRMNQYEKAIEYYQQALAQDVEEHKDEAHRKWGWALDRQSQSVSGEERKSLLNKAFEHYQLAIQLNKKNYEVYNNWAIGLATLGLYELAIALLQPLIDEDMLHSEAYVHLADNYFQCGQTDKARQYYEKACETKPEEAWNWVKFGRFCMEMSKRNGQDIELLSEAKSYFESAKSYSSEKDDRAISGLRDVCELLNENDLAQDYQRRLEL